MALAEIFKAVAGPDAPVEFRAYDGSQAGAAGSAVKITSARRRPRPAWPRRREDSGWPGRMWPGTWTSAGTCTRPWPRMTRAQSISLGLTEKLRLLQALGGPKLLLPGR